MNISQKDREKLIKCIEEIVDYIGTEIAPNILSEIKFTLNGMDFKIKPYKHHFISISSDGYKLFLPNKIECFMEEDDLKPLDLTKLDINMIYILNNWNIIKNKCLEEVNYKKEIIDKINEFKA